MSFTLTASLYKVNFEAVSLVTKKGIWEDWKKKYEAYIAALVEKLMEKHTTTITSLTAL